ncbi:MAG: cupredoxin domain-containing protein, partial [Usitatibacter sp.]
MSRLAAALILAASLSAVAAEGDLQVVIENHKFSPDRIEVPAGKKVKLVIHNRDATPEEF